MAIGGIAIGDGGGIGVKKEVTYGTAETVPIWQHPISAGLAPAKQLRPPKQLATVKPTNRDYMNKYSGGPLVVAYNNSRAVVGDILDCFGNLVTDDYTFGDGGTPDSEGFTSWVDVGGNSLVTGGHQMIYAGCVPTKIRWDFNANGIITMTVECLGQKDGVKATSPVLVASPDEADIEMTEAISAITLGTNALCVLGGFIEVDIPHEGTDRYCLGSSYIKKPQRRGLHNCTGSLQVELADETNNDTEAELDHFIGNTSAGDLVIGDWTLTGCYVTGEVPALQEGITRFPINLEGQSVTLTTVV